MGIALASRLSGWRPLLALAVMAVVGYYLLPAGGVAQAIVLTLVSATAAGCSFRMACRVDGQPRVVWAALGAGMALSALANLPHLGYPLLTGRPLPFPCPVDALWLLTYPCLAVALLSLAALPHGEDYAGSFLDATILAASGGMVLWTFVLDPIVDNSSLLDSVAYPAMGAVLALVVARFLVSTRGTRNAATNLLAAGFIALLAADILYAVEFDAGGYHFGGLCDGLWVLSNLLLAVAAVHPAARSLAGHAVPAQRRAGAGRLDPPAAREAVANVRDEVDREALHDVLTGLANRSLLMDRIEQNQARGVRTGAAAAMLYVDLDDFRNVNDTLGRYVGDRLLQAVAERLTLTIRNADTIARLGGDQFVVVIDEQTVGSAAELVAERILDVLREPFEIPGTPEPIAITASIGLATGWQTTAADLLRDADEALCRAKTAGRDCFAVFEQTKEAPAHRRYELEFELRRALAENQFQLWYQPIYELDRFELVGFEALLRWQHPMYGLIGPAEFIPVLEASGQIVDVGRWALLEACRQMADWHRRGSNQGISVNVSGRQLDREAVVEHVTEALRVSGLEPAKLTLEFAETTLMRNPLPTARRLLKLKRLGVRIAVDDFGTGYSSFAYLEQFPIDCLKIDRTVTDAISRSPESKALMHTLVQVGKDLGLTTLAEGVETTAQLAHLRAESLGEAQGFLLAKPMTVDDVEAVLFPAAAPADKVASHDAA